jgi:hypothetical protein
MIPGKPSQTVWSKVCRTISALEQRSLNDRSPVGDEDGRTISQTAWLKRLRGMLRALLQLGQVGTLASCCLAVYHTEESV